VYEESSDAFIAPPNRHELRAFCGEMSAFFAVFAHTATVHFVFWLRQKLLNYAAIFTQT
jgi:hypothetical protein